jgi:hypothetical protein
MITIVIAVKRQAVVQSSWMYAIMDHGSIIHDG